jgi:hypothetical protein
MASKPSEGAGTKSEALLEDLVQSKKDWTIKVVKLENGQTPMGQEMFRPQCMWCDRLEHRLQDCEEFKEMETRDLVYWKNGKIYLTETRSPLERNFGNGALKVKFKEAESKIASTMYYLATARVRLNDSPNCSTFWQKVLSSAQKKKIKKDDLRAVGDFVRGITGWDAPVDTITAYAQVVEDQKDDHEVIMKDKRKMIVIEAGSTKNHDTRERWMAY